MRQSHIAIIALIAVAGSYQKATAASCHDQIVLLEAAAMQSARNPALGPTTSETVGAKLSHQPTPNSVRQGEEEAEARFANILTRAKKLDAEGRPQECMQAISEAKLLFDFR
jgi:hypothetical protein